MPKSNAIRFFPFFIVATMLVGCASSIVKGEYSRLTTSSLSKKPDTFEVPILIATPVDKNVEVVALVTARAYVLDKAIAELRRQARLAGVDALIDFKQERKVSVDYLQDLYYVEAKGVIYR